MKTTENRNDKPSICFVALNSYNLLSRRGEISHIGGAEVQQWLISQWLLKRGFRVSFVTLDHGQPLVTSHGGLEIFKAYNVEEGILGVRFLYPRWTKLCEALNRADADIYYQRGACSETGQVALWCRLRKKNFIFATASESDCMKSLPLLCVQREKILYRIGLSLANTVVAQTENQQNLLRSQFKIDANIIKNCGNSLSVTPGIKEDTTSVLWVGRIAKEKRFDLLLEVADRCPDIIFDVVAGSNSNSSYSLSLEKRAQGIPNVNMHGRVAYSKIAAFYSNCKVLCCTSEQEGFPNIFLEAWRAGIPVLSTFDPDGIIESQGLGWVAHSVSEIVEKLRNVLQSENIWKKASHRTKEYYLGNHTEERIMPGLEKLLLKISINDSCRASISDG